MGKGCHIGVEPFDAGNFSMTYGDSLAQLINLELQFLERHRLNFSIRKAFRMRAPLALVWPIYPVWSFHFGEHSEAFKI